MGAKVKRTADSKRRAFSSGAFISFTAVAVVIAALLIVLGRVSIPTSTPSTPGLPSIAISGKSKGASDAPVTIVEYSDFQCSHCQQFALTIEPQLDETYIKTGKVRLIYKHLIAYDDESLMAAEASECAAEQNKFWPYFDLLMQVHASSGVEDLPLSKLQSLAQQIGLDMTQFNASLESGKFRDKVMQDDAEGRATGITGIPAFFVNGVKMDDSQISSFEGFQGVIDRALVRSSN